MISSTQPHVPPDVQDKGKHDRSPKVLSGTTQDARPDDLGHEGVTSGVKRNTTGHGERQDRD
jgi:hypothetical protein